MRRLPSAAATLFLLSVFGCRPAPGTDSDREEILALHREVIRAHFDGDIGFFTRDISGDYFSVSGGEIRYPSPEEIETDFRDYLENTEFSRYEDLEEPVIGFSDDGSLAWSIVRVKVEGERRVNPDSTRALDFTCAWITLYRRESGRWIRLGEVSSFE